MDYRNLSQDQFYAHAQQLAAQNQAAVNTSLLTVLGLTCVISLGAIVLFAALYRLTRAQRERNVAAIQSAVAAASPTVARLIDNVVAATDPNTYRRS